MSTIPDFFSEQKLNELFNQMKSYRHYSLPQNKKFRRDTLKSLIKGMEEMKNQFQQALKKDLGYNSFMYDFIGAGLAITEIKEDIAELDSWIKPKKVSSSLSIGIASSSILYEPLGLVLVISAWNYPLYTSLPQVAAAISAGNCVVLKPSQMAPQTSNCLKKLFDKYLDQRFYKVLQGKVEFSKAIVKLPFDMICFTGSTSIGRLVAIQAAKNLTPCLLELGGKCPVVVDETAKIQNAVMRILFAKFINCGQTCVGIDHVYLHTSLKQKFTKKLLQKAQQFYGKGQNLTDEGNYGKIINDFHFDRLQKLMKDEHQGKFIYGGNTNKQKLFIAPTIIDEPNKSCLMMQQEIFGPILPLFTYNQLEEVISEINSREKPLVVYMYSENKKNINLLKTKTSSGSFTVNDSLMQITNSSLPFGGVGASGSGRYHGKAGFKAFSNPKSVCQTMALNSYPVNQRYPPYNNSKKKTMSFLLKYGSLKISTIGKIFGLILLIIIALVAGLIILK